MVGRRTKRIETNQQSLDLDSYQTLMTWARRMRQYHRHQVVGLNNFPSEGPVLLICSHSLATYDIVLLWEAIYKQTGRPVRGLIDRLFFKIPGVGPLCEKCGATEASQVIARDLLEAGEIVCIAPGGMRDMLRPSSERYQFNWGDRLGFTRLAAETGVPIHLAACPRADDVFELYEQPLTKWAYRKFKIPLPVARGLGPSPIPRPVDLTHHIRGPIPPPPTKLGGGEDEVIIRRYHQEVMDEMVRLVGDAIAYRRE